MARYFIFIVFFLLAEGCGMSAALQQLEVATRVQTHVASNPTPTARTRPLAAVTQPLTASATTPVATNNDVVAAQRQITAAQEQTRAGQQAEQSELETQESAAAMRSRIDELLRMANTPVAGPVTPTPPALAAHAADLGQQQPAIEPGARRVQVQFVGFTEAWERGHHLGALLCIAPDLRHMHTNNPQRRCIEWQSTQSPDITWMSYPANWRNAMVAVTGNPGPEFDAHHHTRIWYLDGQAVARVTAGEMSEASCRMPGGDCR